MTYKLMPETIEGVKRSAREAGLNQSEYVEAALREKLEADERRRVDYEPRIEPPELLNHLLEQNGLSQKDLAQILGVDVANASRILKGTCAVTTAHAKRLGERFKLRPALFLIR